jgi:signal transduction histidine kinase
MIKAGLGLDLILPDDAVCVAGDFRSLHRLLSILLDNAAKYTFRGGQITLSADMVNSHVRITVRDTGIGIPASDLPYIFERFYRGKELPANAPGGSGLGLSLAKWIALQHDSILEVSSEAGRGSSFSFLLSIVSHEDSMRSDSGQELREDSQVLA